MTDRPTSYPIRGLFAPPHTLRFEFPEEEPGPATGDEGLEEPEAPAAPAAPEAEAPEAPAEPAQPDWYNSPEFHEAVEQATGQTIEQLLARAEAEGRGQEPQAQPEPFVLDPMADPREFTEGLSGLLGQLLDERLGPVLEPMQGMMERQAGADAQGFVESTIEQLPEVAAVSELMPAPAEGAEDTRSADAADFIELAASGFLPAAEAQYGNGERAVQAALRTGAAHVQTTLKAVHAAGRKSLEDEQKARSGVQPEPTGGSAAEIREAPADEMEWAKQNASRFITH